ncbi:MAG: lipocalin family protein [Saprospiraceae bacterium]|nr:lipocalin family protein [Saprospiraceae bacterium]
MKNAIKILSLLTLVLFAACKKDESTKSSSDIEGTWKLTFMSCDDGQITTEAGGIASSGTFTASGKDYNATVNFKADGTFTSSGSYTQVMSLTVDGFEQTLETPTSDFLENGTYTFDGTTLTTTVDGESGSGEVTVLTDTNLEMEVKIDKTDDFGGQGSSTTKATFIYKMEKQ